MSVLAALSAAYNRLADRGEAPPYGYSTEKIGYLIPLNDDGTPAGLPIDLSEGEGRKKQPRLLRVPAPVKRTSGVSPNSFWDKTSYVLGATAGAAKRTAEEWAAFVTRHREILADADDPGLQALLGFVTSWQPSDFDRLGWPEAMKDQNVVFALESERRQRFLHERPAARALWARLSATDGEAEFACLVTGERGAVARLHPAIKGVWGAQSSGASLISFNLDAFTSYGHEQGDNAPVSDAAAFAYTSALNQFLEKGSRHRLQVGDASTVFWADASAADDTVFAEDLFSELIGGHRIDESAAAGKLGSILEKIRDGRPLAELTPDLPAGVRFYVLGLAPNAARLSVRLWLDDDFAAIGRRALAHLERLRLDPPVKPEALSLWRLLLETASQHKSENIPPNLAGEWLRAILTGGTYPLSLLAVVLMRLRADKDVSAGRVAILKSVLIRNFEKEVPVALDADNRSPGYLLGRLFASYEQIQTAALGRNVNATIRDKFYSSASATPRKVFPALDRGSANHLSKLAKDKRGYAVTLERQVGEIMQHFDAAADPFPAFLSAEQQALFAIGYYQQKFHRKPAEPLAEEITA